MTKQETIEEVSSLSELGLNLKYNELRWILKELRVSLTAFTRNLRISPLKLRSYDDEDNEMPLYIIDELIDISDGGIRLRFLRSKYAKAQGNKTE
jgi:hypothetical protein